VHPTLLVGQGTAVFKRDEVIQDRVREGEEITYFGTRYWYYANPILYYTERYLAPPKASARDTIEAAVETPSRLVLVDRESLGQIPWDDVRARIIFEGDDYQLVRVRDLDWNH
jgi:hypothetical protein